MFEPENDIERALMRASAEPGARAGFARALMDADIFLVLVPEGGPIVPDADGRATIPEGTKLNLASARRGEETLVPFFTAASRAHAWYSGDHIVAPEKMRELFGRFPDASFVLNPGSEYGKEFTPAEVARLLAGQFDDEPRTIVTETPTQVLLAHPKERPDELIAALARELGAVKGVRGAWLMLAMRAGEPEQTWMLGVDHAGDSAEVRPAIGRAVAGDVLKGRLLDAMSLDDGPFSSTLRSGIPIVPAKRGFFNRLFRS
jgi:hypothetical protein